MGQEIPHSSFTKADFLHFEEMLKAESALLKRWFDEGRFTCDHLVGGCELEAWLIDGHGIPAPVNVECLARLDADKAAPELSQFNIELNFDPVVLKQQALSHIHDELVSGWNELRQIAADYSADCVCTGILPTVRDEHLSIEFMSPLNRYAALNEQVLMNRAGKPIRLDIVGREHLQIEHRDVMLESATTSFQIHLKVPQERAARYLNASMILSAPLVALSANSPYLFGHDLWEETRIPVFEQAVASGGYHHAAEGPLKRITFGNGYVLESLWECFAENLEHYPILLPHDFGTPQEQMSHLQLHNGTIWRWNRPLIGFNKDGTPHLRIEQRVVPSGPSMMDLVANMAFYFGLVESMAQQEEPPEMRLDFAMARDNFYQAARYGLDSHIQWLDGNSIRVKKLVLEVLLEQAWEGLEHLGIATDEIHRWLGIIENRVISGQTGSAWQRAWVHQHGRDMHQLLQAYIERQRSGIPVHEWSI